LSPQISNKKMIEVFKFYFNKIPFFFAYLICFEENSNSLFFFVNQITNQPSFINRNFEISFEKTTITSWVILNHNSAFNKLILFREIKPEQSNIYILNRIDLSYWIINLRFITGEDKLSICNKLFFIKSKIIGFKQIRWFWNQLGNSISFFVLLFIK
jgi:hypothetical protein